MGVDLILLQMELELSKSLKGSKFPTESVFIVMLLHVRQQAGLCMFSDAGSDPAAEIHFIKQWPGDKTGTSGDFHQSGSFPLHFIT